MKGGGEGAGLPTPFIFIIYLFLALVGGGGCFEQLVVILRIPRHQAFTQLPHRDTRAEKMTILGIGGGGGDEDRVVCKEPLLLPGCPIILTLLMGWN